MKVLLKRFWFLAIVALLALTVTACGQDDTDDDPEIDTIILAESDWQSHELHNSIVEFIIKNGYGVDVLKAYGSTPAVVQAIKDGDMHVNMEMWSDNISSYEEDLEEGYYHELSVNFDDNYQGLWIPKYLQEEYPEFTSVHDLPEYSHLFENPDSADWDPEEDPGHMYLGSVEFAATKFYENKFDNSDYSAIADSYVWSPVSTSVLNQTLYDAYENEEPWVGYHWTPTAIMAELDMVLLEDEGEYDYDEGTGNLPPNDVTVIATDDMLTAQPEIVDFLKNYETNADIIGQGLIYMSEHDDDSDAAALDWLVEYEDLWTEWVPDEVASDVLGALNEEME